MAEIHKGLKTMQACMKHMTTVMNMESGAAKTRCQKLVKNNNNSSKKNNTSKRSNTTGY